MKLRFSIELRVQREPKPEAPSEQGFDYVDTTSEVEVVEPPSIIGFRPATEGSKRHG